MKETAELSSCHSVFLTFWNNQSFCLWNRNLLSRIYFGPCLRHVGYYSIRDRSVSGSNVHSKNYGQFCLNHFRVDHNDCAIIVLCLDNLQTSLIKCSYLSSSIHLQYNHSLMGIQGLLPLLKDIQSKTHISSFRGQAVGIDTYCWLHKGTYGCAKDLILGKYNPAYVTYVMKRVKMLISYGVTPILVFDGGHLPAKAEKERERRE